MDHPQGPLVQDAKMLAIRIHTTIGHTYRQANQTADCLARMGAEQDEILVITDRAR